MAFKDRLREASASISSGYARDVLNWFIDPWDDGRKIDQRRKDLANADLYAGDMFRSLILDENWSIDEARDLYYMAMDRLEDIRNELDSMDKGSV